MSQQKPSAVFVMKSWKFWLSNMFAKSYHMLSVLLEECTFCSDGRMLTGCLCQYYTFGSHESFEYFSQSVQATTALMTYDSKINWPNFVEAANESTITTPHTRSFSQFASCAHCTWFEKRNHGHKALIDTRGSWKLTRSCLLAKTRIALCRMRGSSMMVCMHFKISCHEKKRYRWFLKGLNHSSRRLTAPQRWWFGTYRQEMYCCRRN